MVELFGFLKKKESSELPEAPQAPSDSFFGDIPSVRGSEVFQRFSLPDVPSPQQVSQSPPVPTPPVPAPIQQSTPQSTIDSLPSTPQVSRSSSRRPVGPLFVSVNDYQEALEHASAVSRAVEESVAIAKRLDVLSDAVEHSLSSWSAQLTDIEKKLSFADEIIEKTGEAPEWKENQSS